MNSLNVIRTITVKQKVTEKLKERMAAEVQEAIGILDQEVQQIEFQVKRAQLTIQSMTPQQQMALRQQMEIEKQKRAEKKQQLAQEVKAIADLPMGSEIVQGNVQSVTTVAVGDDWEELFNLEVLVEDGKVIAIRRGEG